MQKFLLCITIINFMSNDMCYGVDISKEITPIMVRDAIIDCFTNAHNEVLEQMKEYTDFKSEKEFEEMKQIQVKYLIETMFGNVGGDFNNPTKESIIQVVMKLKEYAAAWIRSTFSIVFISKLITSLAG